MADANYETLLVNRAVVDTGSMPLVTDIQYLEPFGSTALNRKFSGILPAGIARGFSPVPGAGLSIDLLHNQTLKGETISFGAALVERDSYTLSVRQQSTINVPVTAGQTTYVVLEGFYQHGTQTTQTDPDSAVESATIKTLLAAEVEDHHVIVCTVTLAADATSVTTSNISTKEREVCEFGNGSGGSTLKTVTVDTTLETGEGTLVDTATAMGEVVITLSADPSEGDEHITGDEKDGSAFTYPIKVVAQGGITVDGEDAFYIDVDGARVTWNYNDEAKNWELSSGFGERSSPKAIFNPYESKPVAGTTVFNVSYTIGHVTVSLNGVELSSDDYTAADGSTITLNDATETDDVIQIKAWVLVDQLEDIAHTRKDWSGTASRGDTVLSVEGLENDFAKAYYLEIGGVRQRPNRDYTVSSATNEVILTEELDNDYDWYLLSEAQVQLYVSLDSEVETDNTNNSLTGSTVKENFDELDAKHESLAEVIRENLLINGDFYVNQRDTADGTYVSGDFLRDRWLAGALTTPDGNEFTSFTEQVNGRLSRCIALDGYFLTESDSDWIVIGQRVEDVGRFSGATLTASFDVRGSESGVVAAGLNGVFGDDPNSALAQGLIDVTTSWNRVSVTFVVPDISGNAIDDSASNLYFQIQKIVNSSSGYWDNSVRYDGTLYIANVKLEYGDKATPFIPDDPATNLAKCQRYYYASGVNRINGGYNQANAYANWYDTFPVPMRAVPSVSGASQDTAGVAIVNIPNVVEVDGMRNSVQRTTTTGVYYIRYSFTADAEL